MDATFIAGMTALPEYEHRALLLDDDDANRMLLSVALQMGQLPFEEAANGKAALEVWKPGKFSFAFLDIDLPDIKGIEVGRQIREQDKGIVIIMCSANDDPITMAQAVEIDCDMFFIKPFELHTLLNTIKGLDRAAMRANPRILVVDNTQRPRWENRIGVDPNRATRTMQKLSTDEITGAHLPKPTPENTPMISSIAPVPATPVIETIIPVERASTGENVTSQPVTVTSAPAETTPAESASATLSTDSTIRSASNVLNNLSMPPTKSNNTSTEATDPNSADAVSTPATSEGGSPREVA